jgi:DNA-binding FadR family transcriptional regulator
MIIMTTILSVALSHENGGIIDAVAAGDGARARSVIERHWANGAKRTHAMIAR